MGGLLGVFISYRREDSGGYAPLVYRALRRQFGKRLVFMDIDTIRAGEDYRAAIREAIDQSDVFLSLMGRGWVRSADDQGRRRLDDPGDLVRAEIGQALGRKMAVIPVLLNGAQMPAAEALPEDLRPLVYLNAHECPEHFFEQSLKELVEVLKPKVPRAPAISRRKALWLGAGGAAAVNLALLPKMFRHPEATVTPASKAKAPHTVAAVRNAPRVVLRNPENARSVPAGIPGAWKIDATNFASLRIGPRTPKVLWESPVTIGSSWDVFGFAPDGTVFVIDAGNSAIGGVAAGAEKWGYRLVSGGLEGGGVTPGGCVWVDYYGPRYCFNSAGEGGVMLKSVKAPGDLIRWPKTVRESGGACSNGEVKFWRSPVKVPLDGNCTNWDIAMDGQGRFYQGTDHGTLYCFTKEGKVLWTYNTGEELRNAPVFSMGDAVFGVGGKVVCMRDGTLRWEVALRGCQPSLTDKAGTVYVSYEEGLIDHAVAAVDSAGQVLWRQELQGEPIATAIDPAGQLYVRDQRRGTLVCLG